jgi:hypothetical protein
METIVLQEGTQATVYYIHDMWRASIGGRDYCSQIKENLLRCISECHNAVIPEIPPEPVRPLADILFSQLKTGALEQKQDARRRLLDIASKGDEDAISYLQFLPDKKISMSARYLAKSLGKDFIDVTFAELSENVNDLVLRNKLMKELSSLFEMNNASSK